MWITGVFVGVGSDDFWEGGLQTVIPQRLAVPSEGVSLRQEPSGRSFSTQPLVEPQRHLQTVTKQVIVDVCLFFNCLSGPS